MKRFYDGKRCLITGLLNSVNWCHILDASLAPSNQRVRAALTPPKFWLSVYLVKRNAYA